jgi:hypothetical protein
MANVGETVAPTATVTEAGTVTPGSLLASVTVAPPDGALPFKVTLLPFEDAPPTRETGARFRSDTAGATTVRLAVLVTPPELAEMVTARLVATGVVVMINVGETVVPAATVTEAGRVTLGSLLLSATTMPPLGAGPFSETVFEPVMLEPPSTEVGDSDTADTETVEGGVRVRVAVLVTPL